MRDFTMHYTANTVYCISLYPFSLLNYNLPEKRRQSVYKICEARIHACILELHALQLKMQLQIHAHPQIVVEGPVPVSRNRVGHISPQTIYLRGQNFLSPIV